MNIIKRLYKMLFDKEGSWKKEEEPPVPKITPKQVPTPKATGKSTPVNVNPVLAKVPNTVIGAASPISVGGVTGFSPSSPYGSTGLSSRRVFSPTGMMTFGATGIVGITGMTGMMGSRISEDEWENPKMDCKHGVTRYHVKETLHCAFGPACITEGSAVEIWCIKGQTLSQGQIEEMKGILNDIKKAPLYLNHDIFKYAAKHVLKNVGGA